MKTKSKTKGATPHYMAGVGTFAASAFLGPFSLLLYPFFLALAKKDVSEEMDKIDIESDLEIGKDWEQSRPWEKFCKVSTTRFSNGILPLSMTREHTFTRD